MLAAAARSRSNEKALKFWGATFGAVSWLAQRKDGGRRAAAGRDRAAAAARDQPDAPQLPMSTAPPAPAAADAPLTPPQRAQAPTRSRGSCCGCG